MPARISAASNRTRNDAGSAAKGPRDLPGGIGGSSTPMPVTLRGGTPPRADAACASSSRSRSKNSYGINEVYRWLSERSSWLPFPGGSVLLGKNVLATACDAYVQNTMNAGARKKAASEQAKSCFDGDPRCHGMFRAVSGRNKFPAAHSFDGALVETEADALQDTDVLRVAVGADQYLQRDRTLHFGFARIVGVSGIRAIRTDGWDETRPIPATIAADAVGTVVAVTESSILARADAVFVSWTRRVRDAWHPLQADSVDRTQDGSRARIQDCWRLWQSVILALRKYRLHKLDGGTKRRGAGRCRNRISIAAASVSIRRVYSRGRANDGKAIITDESWAMGR